MRILLDTHILLWWLAADQRLPKRANSLISDAVNDIFVSAASVWEIAIKAALGRIKADAIEVASAIGPSGFIELAVTAKHASEVSQLPLLHHDPFDRLLLAQCLSEPMRLLTHDKSLTRYSQLVIPV